MTGNPIDNIWNLFKDESKIELFNYMDPIRPPKEEGGKPIVYIDILNTFFQEIGVKKKLRKVKGYEVRKAHSE